MTVEATAVVLVDPYNDFTSVWGRGWPLVREVAKEVGLIGNLKRLLHSAREQGVEVVYAPHKRHRRNAETPRFPTPTQYLIPLIRFFSASGYGGRIREDLAPLPGEFVASEHPVTSGFGGTDLHAHLQSAGITHLIVVGLLTNTCIESTVRHGVDLGYHVTVVDDAVAAWSHEDHAAGLSGSLPSVAHRMVSTEEVIGSISKGARS